MYLLPLQAGLTVGDLILAVNKDTLLGSTHEAVSDQCIHARARERIDDRDRFVYRRRRC